MKVIAGGAHVGYYLYWGELAASLGTLTTIHTYPKCLSDIEYEPDENVLIPGEFL